MEVTSFSKSGEHEIRNRKEENNMDENTEKRLDQQFAFIREIDREKFIGILRIPFRRVSAQVSAQECSLLSLP